LAAGAGAVLGHMFPVWLSFKGGKGGATVHGVFLGLSWPIVAVGAVVWLLVLATLRYSSLATLLATALGAASAWWLSPRPVAVLAAVLVVLVWAKHHENIRRLLAGTESKVGGTKSA
jgi:glycerol-3-phosphate acyltransferase PlsY